MTQIGEAQAPKELAESTKKGNNIVMKKNSNHYNFIFENTSQGK
jgi:hypothetical protein